MISGWKDISAMHKQPKIKFFQSFFRLTYKDLPDIDFCFVSLFKFPTFEGI